MSEIERTREGLKETFYELQMRLKIARIEFSDILRCETRGVRENEVLAIPIGSWSLSRFEQKHTASNEIPWDDLLFSIKVYILVLSADWHEIGGFQILRMLKKDSTV